MNTEAIKKIIDLVDRKYKDISPIGQKLITTLAGAGIGAGVGSIPLGKRVGYMLGSDKKRSRTIGALAGAMAGLHVPTRENSEKKASVDLGINWDTVKQKIDAAGKAVKGKLTQAKDWYGKQDTGTRALVGAGAGLGAGALLGKLVGRTGTGAAVGALTGAGAAGTAAYWNDIRKAIDAAKPTVGNAVGKAKERIDAIVKKLRVDDKKLGTEENAQAKAQAASGAVK